MKHKKGSRKPKSKRGHNENATARFRARFVNGERLIFPIDKSSLPTAKLKESAEVMKGVFPESNELLSNTVLPSSEGVKEAVEKIRPRAEVVPIGRNTEARSRASPVQSDAQIIANLEAVINNTTPATNEESVIVGPPKPKLDTSAWMPKPKLATVHGIVGDEAIGKATPSTVDERTDGKPWVKLYGTCIKDTGGGMTPSGKRITDFLEGGKHPPTGTMRTDYEWGATTEYTHEELAELYDMQQVEMHELKIEYDKRIAVLNEQVSDLSEALDQERDSNKIKGFNDSHASFNGEFEVAIIELQNDNSYLTLEKEELRLELEHYGDIIDQQSDQLTSARSKATLKTLALQYQIYKKQHEEDSLRNFFRQSDYCISQLGALRQYFDDACEMRMIVSEERKVYNKWASKPRKYLRWACRTRDELRSLRRLRDNCVLHRASNTVLPSTDCKHLAKQEGRVWYSHSTAIESKDYESMCEGFKSITPRHEYDDDVVKDANLKDDKRRLGFLSHKPMHKIIKAGVTTAKALKELGNFELSPKLRRKATKEAQRIAKASEVEGSKVKRRREQEYEEREQMDMIREAMRVAH